MFHKTKTPNKSLYNVSQKKENVKKRFTKKKNIWRLKKCFKKRKTRNKSLYNIFFKDKLFVKFILYIFYITFFFQKLFVKLFFTCFCHFSLRFFICETCCGTIFVFLKFFVKLFFHGRAFTLDVVSKKIK